LLVQILITDSKILESIGQELPAAQNHRACCWFEED
jgi:hypothetical protein